MGMGLILAGLGKGIADAGSTYGNMMFKASESELADQRAMQRAEALERLKEQMAEERSQKDATKAIEVEGKAAQIGQDRAAKQVSSDASSLAANASRMAGDAPAMTADEMKAHLASLSPSERKAVEGTGLIGRSLTRNEQRLQSAEDSVQAARELGASSNLLKSYQESKKAVLDAIKEENRETKEENRAAEERAREERRDREGRERYEVESRRAGAAEVSAGAAEIRANRPEKGSSQERLTTMVNSANQTIKSLNEGSRGKTPEEKADWQRQMNDAVKLRDNAQSRLNRLFDEDNAPAKPSKPSDNQKPAKTISSLPSGAIQIGTSGGKPVYQTPDGKKFIRN